MVAQAVGRLISAPAAALGEATAVALAQSGAELGAAEAVYLHRLGSQRLEPVQSWSAEPEADGVLQRFAGRPASLFHWRHRLRHGEIVEILPHDLHAAAHGLTRAVLLVPVLRPGCVRAVVVFAAPGGAPPWQEPLAVPEGRNALLLLAQSLDAACTRAMQSPAVVTPRHGAGLLDSIADVVRDTGHMVAITDAKGRIEWVNDAYERQTGYRLAELIGRRPGVLLQADATDAATKLRIRAALDAGRAVTADMLNRRKDGSTYWVNLDIRPRHDAEGRLAGFTAIQSVVTRHKRVEDAARRAFKYSDSLLRSLFELSPVGLALNDLKTGAFVDASPRLVEPTGYTRDEFLALSYWDVTPEEYAEGEALALEQLRTTGRYGPYEKEYIRKDGSRYPVLLNGVLTTDTTGRELIWSVVEDISKRKQYEVQQASRLRDVQKAQRRLENAISVLPDGFAQFDADDRLVLYNARFREIYPELSDVVTLGVRYEDFLRSGVARGMFREAVGREEEWIAETMESHRSGSGVAREATLSDGRIIRVIEKPTPEGGRAGLRSDITSLRDAEQRLANIIAAAQAGTWEWSTDTGISRINDRWAEMLGLEREAIEPVTEEKWKAMIHPDDLPVIDRAMTRFQSGLREAVEYEFRMRHADGHWLWVQSRGRVTRRDADGGVIIVAGVHLDIDARRRQQAALEASHTALQKALAERDEAEQRFFDIESVSSSWFWEQDAELRFTYVSSSFYKITGFRPEELIGKSRIEVYGTNEKAQATADWDWLAERYAQHESFDNFVYLLGDESTGFDRPIWLHVSGKPFFDSEGQFAGYRGTGSEVSQLVLARLQAEEANRSKSEFLASMSHEVRTPLNGMLGMAELLEPALTDPGQREMLATIRESGTAMVSLLDGILDMSRVDAGKLELESRPFRLKDVCGKVAGLHGPLAREKGLEFVTRIEGCPEDCLCGDALRVQQILHNLVSNAIKFTEQGRITIAMTYSEAAGLRMSVEDTGIGMTPAQRERLFRPFEQADGSISRRYGGSGLGMAIVDRLVALMAGRIEVESEPGRGTAIAVNLPLKPAQEAADPVPVAAPASLPAGLRVLAADDNATNRRILELLLKRQAVDVRMVEDGAQAIAAWAPERFDVVLLDIAMPVVDGLGALKEIRRMEAEAGCAPTPAIAVSANAMSHQVSEYLQAGFDAHVAKPVSGEKLAQAITGQLPQSLPPDGG